MMAGFMLTLRSIFKYLGSLNFAIFLIVTLAVVLTVSTTLESVYGTDFAQIFIYRTAWFDLFLGLVGVNILFSALLRWPYKLAHAGFLVTHIGILVLLAGSMMTRVWGIEGSLLLYEGQQSRQILRDAYKLKVTDAAGGQARVELPYKSLGPQSRSVYTSGPFDVRLEGSLANVVRDNVWAEGAASDPLNYAIEVTLSSAKAGFKKTFWLAEKIPGQTQPNVLELGPAVLTLARAEKIKASLPVDPPSAGDPTAPSVPSLTIRIKGIDQPFTIDPLQPPAAFALAGTDFTVSEIHYYPDARVEGKKLVTVSEQPNNPAVEFEVSGIGEDGQPTKLRYTTFALYPDYASFHDSDPQIFEGIRAVLEVPGAAAPPLPSPAVATDPRAASLKFVASPDGWSYESLIRGQTQTGALQAGEIYPAGWMDFQFEVHQLLSRALAKQQIRPQPALESKILAAQITVLDEGRPLFSDWLVDGEPVDLRSASGQRLRLLVDKDTAPIPFTLTLKDFRKVDYPGSFRPSSFESDVLVQDTQMGMQIERTIRMNQPMDYRGYRIFQSSFLQDDDGSEASIFTVSKNPGIRLIYPGSVILVVGIFMVFFIRPLSTLKMQPLAQRSS